MGARAALLAIFLRPRGCCFADILDRRPDADRVLVRGAGLQVGLPCLHRGAIGAERRRCTLRPSRQVVKCANPAASWRS